MLSTSYSNKSVSWVCYLTLQINIIDTINRWIQLVTCGNHQAVIWELHLVSRCTSKGACRVAAARPKGTFTLSSLEIKSTAWGLKSFATSRMSSMKDLAYIRSTFFFLRDASGCSSFTGTIETCLFPSDVLPRRGTNLWKKNDKKTEGILTLHFKQFDCIILSRLGPNLN